VAAVGKPDKASLGTIVRAGFRLLRRPLSDPERGAQAVRGWRFLPASEDRVTQVRSFLVSQVSDP